MHSAFFHKLEELSLEASEWPKTINIVTSDTRLSLHSALRSYFIIT